MIRTILAFIIRDLRREVSYRFSFFLQVLGFLPIVVMFFYLSRLVGPSISGPLGPYGGSYFPFALIGISVHNYLTLAISSFTRSLRDSQLSGTLEAVMATPVGLHPFLIGSSGYSFCLNSLRVLIYLGFGSLVFSIHFHWARLPSVLLVLLLTIASFTGLGIFSAGFTLLFKRGDPVNWTINMSSWFLGGVYFPVSLLPGWAQKAAAVIPMTHTLESLRMILINGSSLGDVGDHLLVLGLWALVGLPLSIICFRLALRRTRVLGTLGHY
jgi:ABC-2 type transport system permease protein